MSILSTLLKAQDGNLVRQLASNFNLEEGQAQSAIGQLLPALTSRMSQNIQGGDGLNSLLRALDKGDHEKYVKQPDVLSGEEAQREGNAILGHVLGSKDVSRNVANQAAEKTGLDVGILKKMLPVVASMAMGALSQKGAQGGLVGKRASAPSTSKAQGMLTSLLDADQDGSVVDDLLGFAKKLF